jgi:hypothetical protein
MTKVQIRFKLQQPPTEHMLERLSDTNAFYGIQKIQLSPAMDGVMVEYDATRLQPAQVESALLNLGIAVARA